MNCPECNEHLFIMIVMYYFTGRCPSGIHKVWGNVDRGSDELIVKGLEIGKRLKNKHIGIRHIYDYYYDIIRYKKRKISHSVRIDIETYQSKYENDPKALIKLLELSEVFV